MGSLPERLVARTLRLGVVASVVGAARPALACAVCAAGPTDNRAEFILTTAFMTALPLILVGSLVLYLRARARRLGSGSAEAPGALEGGRRAA